MRFISHRGNIDGKRVALENSEVYIKKALDKGYDVEIDVWYLDHSFWLGHDTPKDAVSETFLKHPNLWIHAKNIAALYHLKDGPNNVFFHNNDDFDEFLFYHKGNFFSRRRPGAVAWIGICIPAPRVPINIKY